MKLLISGYGNLESSMQLIEIDEQLKHRTLDKLSLSAPTFFVSGKDDFFTYEKKSPVNLHHFHIRKDKLIIEDSISFEGDDLTHLTYSKKHDLLIGCSYKNGSFFSVKLIDGLFNDDIQHEYQVEGENLSRAHCVTIRRDEEEVAIINIALDKVFFYKVIDNQLIFHKEMKVPVGSGPRHGVYLNDDIFYIITEYSNEMIVIDLKKNEILQTITTIPNFKDKSSGATLLISNDQKYLYASNRGEDSIAIFEILKSFKLKYIKSISCGGMHPRHMALSKDNQYIFSCNMHSNHVSVIDIKSEKVVLDIPFEKPSCVLEI